MGAGLESQAELTMRDIALAEFADTAPGVVLDETPLGIPT
jgi:hypothetical protein